MVLHFKLIKKLMHKYKIVVEYDGSNFVGWQKQENGLSIQQSIENSIKQLSSENATVFGAGRTDSGVHAKGQVAHFELSKKISLDNIRDGLNQYLRPSPISILKAEVVDENFHARFSAKLRHYEYLIINRRPPLTFNKFHAWGVHKQLNFNNMKEATSSFIGRHDFNAFRSIDCQATSTIKTIESCIVKKDDQFIRGFTN